MTHSKFMLKCVVLSLYLSTIFVTPRLPIVMFIALYIGIQILKYLTFWNSRVSSILEVRTKSIWLVKDFKDTHKKLCQVGNTLYCSDKTIWSPLLLLTLSYWSQTFRKLKFTLIFKEMLHSISLNIMFTRRK